MNRLRSVSTLLAAQGLTTLGQLAFTILTTRWLPMEDRGALIAFLSVGNIVAMVVAGGLSISGRRDLSRDHDADDVHDVFGATGAAVLISIGAGLVIGAPILAFSGALVSPLLIPLLAVFAAAHAAQLLANAYIYASGKYAAALLATSTYSIGQVVVILALQGAGQLNLISAATTSCIATMALAAVLFGRVRSLFPQPRSLASVKSAVSRYMRSLIDLPGALNMSMLQSVERVIISAAAGPASLTIYVAGSSLRLPLGMTQNAVSQIRFLEAARDEKPALWKLIAATVSVNATLAAVLGLSAPLLVPLVFGEDLLSAVPVAQLALVAGVIQSAYGLFVADLQGRGAHRSVALLTMVSFGTTLPLVAVLSYLQGATGAAVAVLIATVLTTASAVLVHHRALR